jgi:predicted adenylyl cyclase CyaB
MARNIELKARCDNLAEARAVAERLATATLEQQRQIDTYFARAVGRLKLRQIATLSGSIDAQLVWYRRADQTSAKASDYTLVSMPSTVADSLKVALTFAYGVLVVVDKRREIFLHHNVRIHLDEVVGLGTFLEFEAVLGPEIDESAGLAQIAGLRRDFSIEDSALIAGSYSDLLLSQ